MVEINDLLGIPYKDHGRDASGMDCYGLAIEVQRRYGYKLHDVVYDCHALELENEKLPTLNVHRIAGPETGALIEMQWRNELHIGVCLNTREFIHMTRTGCRVSQIGAVKVRGYYGCNTRI